MNEINKMFSLNGKTAIVTGGAGKYGRQIVLALAQAGAKVCTASRNLAENEKYAANLREQGYDVFAEAFDQGSEESILNVLQRLVDKVTKIDIFVNNAVLRSMNSFADDVKKFEESMKVNATGSFLLLRAFGDHMSKNGGGSMINIGSYMGLVGGDDTLYKDVSFSAFSLPDYFFHKAGLTNLTRVIAGYYGPQKVRCNILALGGFFCGQDELFVNRYNERTFLKRMANETDIMGSIVFLASDASNYITGSVIPVDGGYTAK